MKPNVEMTTRARPQRRFGLFLCLGLASLSLIAAICIFAVVVPLLRVSPLLTCRCPNVRPLITGRVGADHPAWSPNGQWIAFDQAKLTAPRIVPSTSEIYVVGSTGKDLRRLTQNNTEDTYPTWSPDSGSLVFASDQSYLQRLEVASGKSQVIYQCPFRCDSPTWSYDGKWIAFRMAATHQAPEARRQIWVLDMNTLQAHQLIALDEPSEGLAWSADSSRLFFTRYVGPAETIEALPLKAAKLEALPLEGNVAFPAWSANGNVFAFVRMDRTYTASEPLGVRIFVSGSTYGSPVPVIEEIPKYDMSSPSLSPDGKFAVFVVGAGPRRELYIVDVSMLGGAPQ